MRSIKGSLVGLVLAGILAIVPTAAFAHGGGGGHGGGFSGGGHGSGGFGAGGGHFGGAHFAGGSHFGGGHFDRSGGHGFEFHRADHFRHFGHGGFFWDGDPYGYDYPYYGYYNYGDGDYSDAQTAPSEVAPTEETIVAVQKELAKLGYYHGQIDGIIGRETRKAISWFQSVDKLSVSGRIDDPTLKALQIS
jgi:Putative peptidoglycan binding domain